MLDVIPGRAARREPGIHHRKVSWIPDSRALRGFRNDDGLSGPRLLLHRHALLLEQARERVRERLLLIERVLAGPFLLPSGFSLLDIYAAMFSRWSVGVEWRERNLPRLNQLARLVSQRPAITPVWRRHFEKR